MPRIRVEVVQGQPFVSFDSAARSLASAVTAYLSDIDEQYVKRVETHSYWDGERWLFLAFAWLREEEEEEEEEEEDGMTFQGEGYDDTPVTNTLRGRNHYV